NFAKYRTVEGLYERIAAAALAATSALGATTSTTSAAAARAAAASAAAHADAELEGREAFRLLLDALRPGPAFAGIQHVRDIPVRIDRIRRAHGPAEQLIQRFVKNFAGKIPEGDIDAADGGHVRHE